MEKARYTIKTWGNQTVVHLVNPKNYPLAEFRYCRIDEGDARAALPEKPKKGTRRNNKRKGR